MRVQTDAVDLETKQQNRMTSSAVVARMDDRARAKPKLSWLVPRWAFTLRLWKQLNLILNRGSLIRISLGTIVVSVAIVAGFKWAFPQMAIPNLWPLVFALPAILLILVFQFAILTLIPPTVTIRSDKIVVSHGQSSTLIDPATVTATYLTFYAENRIRLRICYTKQSKNKSHVIGVPPTVDFVQLTELLPIPPQVRDAHTRSIPTGKPAENRESTEE